MMVNNDFQREITLSNECKKAYRTALKALKNQEKTKLKRILSMLDKMMKNGTIHEN